MALQQHKAAEQLPESRQERLLVQGLLIRSFVIEQSVCLRIELFANPRLQEKEQAVQCFIMGLLQLPSTKSAIDRHCSRSVIINGT